MFFTFPFSDYKPAFASFPPSILKWSVVDTPSPEGNVIRSVTDTNSEINRIAFGPNDTVMYAVDVPSVNAPLVNSMYKLYQIEQQRGHLG